MMNENERETPLTDKAKLRVPSIVAPPRLVDATYYGEQIVKADFARKLERMCAELAERLHTHTDMLCVCGDNDCHKDKQALAKYTAMKEGK